MKVEIIVPTINLWSKYTHQCIDSLMDAMMRAKEHNIDCHLTLIDNASTDETVVEAPKLNNSLFLYIRNEDRWGFQKSVNTGINEGIKMGADFFLVCNNDITIHPESIWRLIERFNGDPVGMVTCMDVAGEMREKGLNPNEIGRLVSKDKEGVNEAPNPHFSCFCVSKECWEIVGMFDEEFAPAYFEDNSFAYRMKLLGIPAIVLPTAMFFHYGSKTQREASENGQPIVNGGLFENNRATYIRMWGGQPDHEKFLNPYNDKTLAPTKTKDPLSFDKIEL